jgi:hypothetical protein
MLAAVARIRRLQSEIEQLETALHGKKRRSAVTRANYHKWIAQNRGAIQTLMERLPLKPALVDEMVSEIRRQVRRLEGLRGGKELRELEKEVGLTRKSIVSTLREIEQHDQWCVSQARADGGQSPARCLGRQAVPRERAVPARPGPGRQHRPDEGGGSLPVSSGGSSSPPMRPGGSGRPITRAIADHSRTIRIPVHMVETLNRISRVKPWVSCNEMGREPTPEELAKRTGVPTQKVRLILESSRKPLSWRLRSGRTPSWGLPRRQGRWLPQRQPDQPGPDDAGRAGTIHAVAQEKKILRLRFGIGEEGEHTLEEVGKRFAVTRERIRQIETKALRKLRHPLRGRGLRAFVEKLA